MTQVGQQNAYTMSVWVLQSTLANGKYHSLWLHGHRATGRCEIALLTMMQALTKVVIIDVLYKHSQSHHEGRQED